MARTPYEWKGPLIMAICLPLAVILGYLLAEPMRMSGLFVLVLMFSMLFVPLLLKWHWALLVFSCNTMFICGFLPGQPPIWLLAALLGFVFAVANRSIDARRRLMTGDAVSWSLLCLAGVVALTAMATGGFGARVFGSTTYGGRRYFYIAGAILAYFVLARHRVPASRAVFYASLFFLSGATVLLGNLVFMAGSSFYWLFYFVPAEAAMEQLGDSISAYAPGIVRISGLVSLSSAVCLFLLARYGVKGLLDLSKPWRFLLAALFFAIGLYGGFRSFVLAMGLIFTIAFFTEGLHRTRYLLGVLGLGLVCGLCLVAFSTELPLTVQRALSFLPLEFNALPQRDAQGSLDWRLEMWRILSADIPRYLLLGKGCGLTPDDLALSFQNAYHSYGPASEWAMVSGDYHNGPLSVLIPFGIWGALAVGWFFVAATRALYRNCVDGDPALRTINRAIFACFLGRVIFFLVFFGSLYSDLVFFTCLAGLGMSLNQEFRAPAPQPEPEVIPSLAVPRIGAGSRI